MRTSAIITEMMKVEEEGQRQNRVGLATRKGEDELRYGPIINLNRQYFAG
jgi:hypothetical protein